MKTFKTTKLLFTLLFLIFGAGSILSQGVSDLGYIYGTVTTSSNKTYEGFMRWGKEEIAWHDVFNSTKRYNKFKKPAKKSSGLRDLDWNISSLWKNNYSGSSRSFSCFFGDIQKLEIDRHERVIVYLKNGETIEVEGGSNDIGATISIQDFEMGTLKLDWDRIEAIAFSSPPRGVIPEYDMALYGEVETRRGENITGYIKWDVDERITTDILDGDNCCTDDEIMFSRIQRIEKSNKGSMLTLTTGKSFEITGTNDVNSGNRGIGVYVEGFGSMEIPWKQFRSLDFDNRTIAGPPYEYFQIGASLEGTVITYDDGQHEGMIIFDLDEMYGAEMLDGNEDGIEYQIPFRNIKSIIPKNDTYSKILLRNGDTMLLGDTQDVSDSNDGIIIVGNTGENTYVDWDDVDEIIFKK